MSASDKGQNGREDTRPPKRGKDGRFAPGHSGNPRGAPRKEERHLLPRQMRKEILRLLDQQVSVNTAKGPKKMSGMEFFLTTIMHKAGAGNATAMRMWIRLAEAALQDRVTENAPVKLLDSILDHENRGRAQVHNFEKDDFDLRKTTKDIY